MATAIDITRAPYYFKKYSKLSFYSILLLHLVLFYLHQVKCIEHVMEQENGGASKAIAEELPVVENVKTIEDDRIRCSNSSSLNKMLEIAVKHVTELAESHELVESKPQFVARFTEVFKDIIQSNISVEDLPWVVNKEMLSSVQKEEQKLETDDALLTSLSKNLEVTAHKRKHFPKDCSRIFDMKLKHERQNLKKLNIQYSVPLPNTVSNKTENLMSLPHQELAEVCLDMNLSQDKIHTQSEALQRLQSNFNFAQEVMLRQKPHLEALYDTGYLSE